MGNSIRFNKKTKHWQVLQWFYVDGQRKFNARTLPTLAAAKQHQAKITLLEQRRIGAPRISLGDYLSDWLDAKCRDVELTTAAGYRRWVGHIQRAPQAKLALDRVAAIELEQIYRFLLDHPASRGKPLSPQSVRHCHALLENALGDAVRHRRIDANPATYAKAPRGQSPRRTMPDAEQIGAMLDDLTRHSPEMADLAVTIVGTGLRRSEVLGLRFADIDWSGLATIAQVVIEHNGRWSIRQGTKSIAGQRTISIADPVLAALRRQQVRVAELRLKIGPHWRDHDLCFPDLQGEPRAPASVTRAFTRAARRAGWPAHSSPVHSLRHAAASHALAGGINLAVIANRLGHSSPAVTARIYLHGDAARDRQAAEIMAAIPRRKMSERDL